MTLRSLFRSSIPDSSDSSTPPASSPSKRRSLVRAVKKTVDLFAGTPSTASQESIASSGQDPPGPTSPIQRFSERLSTPRRRSLHAKVKHDHVPGDAPDSSDARLSLGVDPDAELTHAELLELFHGAPEFVFRMSREVGSGEVQYHADVRFPFGVDEERRWMTDHRKFTHAAYALASSRNEGEDMIAVETPSMLSFMGSEPGTVGWEYFLTLPVGDAERGGEQHDERIDAGGRERDGGLRARGGVRSVEVGYIAERLRELGAIWQGKKKKKRKEAAERTKQVQREGEDEEEEENEETKDWPTSVDLYTHLFSHLLYPPTRVADEDYHDPYSLKVQAMALVQTLSKGYWLDFGDVSWRIKLGQVLWGNLGLEDDDDPSTAASKDSEKMMLLLQILLAAELVVRLDTLLSEDENLGGASPSPLSSSHSDSPSESRSQMLRRFCTAGGSKVQWDILLARRWLNSIRITEPEIDTNPPTEKPLGLLGPTRWFGSSQPDPPPPAPSAPCVSGITDAWLVPRNPRRQIDGILTFAKRLQWPNTDALAYNLLSTLRPTNTPASSIYNTPLAAGTPLSLTSTTASSYFHHTPSRRRLAQEVPKLTHKRSVLTIPSPETSGGWLSRSFLTGLVLPGEGMCHIIISTLLENDPAAVEALGFNANLYAGFQYEGRTWWSRYCILGKVLSGLEGVAEEIGWVGPCPPSGIDGVGGAIPDSWVDVVTLPPLEDGAPRATKPEQVEHDSNLLGRKHQHEQQQQQQQKAYTRKDFLHVPRPKGRDMAVTVKGISFDPVQAESEFQAYEVSIQFGLPRRNFTRLHLKHDVNFIAAWPCNKQHLLHKDYAHRLVGLEELLMIEEDAKVEDKEVLLIDLYTPEQRTLVYAWCAMRGWNAVVARTSRTCGGCAVREAWAVGVRVVIRAA